ncbi:MAG: hypothetical protein ACRDY6_22400 [Acidimicrobiia bacterium]
MSEQEAFTPGEWRTLQLAPFWIFSALVGAYRNIDPLEYEAFWRSLDVAASTPGRLSREVLASITTERGRLTEQYETDSRTIARGLCAVAEVLDTVPTDEADMFKDMLLSGVGLSVAMARGRFGRVVSEDDEKTLALVAQFLS